AWLDQRDVARGVGAARQRTTERAVRGDVGLRDVPLRRDLLAGQVLEHAADLDLLPRQRVRPGRLDLGQPAGVEITVVEKQAGARRRRRARAGRGRRDPEAGLRIVDERAAVVEVRVAGRDPAGDHQLGYTQ